MVLEKTLRWFFFLSQVLGFCIKSKGDHAIKECRPWQTCITLCNLCKYHPDEEGRTPIPCRAGEPQTKPSLVATCGSNRKEGGHVGVHSPIMLRSKTPWTNITGSRFRFNHWHEARFKSHRAVELQDTWQTCPKKPWTIMEVNTDPVGRADWPFREHIFHFGHGSWLVLWSMIRRSWLPTLAQKAVCLQGHGGHWMSLWSANKDD